jgi:gamma-glutamyl-gamma-aminobutyrate hydrolase PuuD
LNASEPYRPRIGLTTYYQEAAWGVWTADAALLPGTYVNAVVAAGGTPVLLPPVGTDPSIVDLLDGLIIAGGTDVGPEHYDAAPHALTHAQPSRDGHDLSLTRAALAADLPLFSICRGAQVLNVALGGTLIQHVPDVLPASRYQPAPGMFGNVEFTTAPGSIIEALLGPRASAPCYHHQALERVADGLRVTAAAPDGTIEAVETTSGGWVLGVQFHPEQDPGDLRLFESFVEAARTYRISRTEGTVHVEQHV